MGSDYITVSNGGIMTIDELARNISREESYDDSDN